MTALLGVPSVEVVDEARTAIVAALQECARELVQDYLTRSQYETWRIGQQKALPGDADRLPSLSIIVHCFENFDAALGAAGLRTFQEERASDRVSYARERPDLSNEESLAVTYALSIFIGDVYTGERSPANRLCQIVGALADVEGPRRKGGWPYGKSVLAWLGILASELDDQWRDAKRRSSYLLSAELLGAFVPPRLWKALYELIEAGPLETCERVQALLQAWAIGRELTGETREQRGVRKSTLDHGGLSEGSIDALTTAVFGFMQALDKLRVLEKNGKLELPGDRRFYAHWNKADFPARLTAAELGAIPANTNRDAPSLRLVRLVLQILCEEIEALKMTSMGRRRLFQPLRDRAMIATFVITGLRRGALSRLKVADIVECYSFPDGEHGPAIIARPGKSVSRDLKRPKGIPEFLFDWIKEYADHAGIWGEKDLPLWLPNNRSTRSRGEPLSEGAINPLIARRFTPKRPRSGEPVETRPLQRAFVDEYDGRVYGPHELRHAAEQIGWVAGFDWLDENRTSLLENGAGLPANPQVFPDTLLDHSMSSLGDRYKDVSSERGRLKWARKCALGIGGYVFGEKGARRGPDLKLIHDRECAVRDAEARKAEIEAQLAAVDEKVANAAANIEGKDILLGIFQSLRLARELGPLGEAVEHARNELAEARKAQVPMPDHLTNAELEALHGNPAAVADLVAEEDDAEIPVIRDWASLQEFHWALGGQTAVSLETLRRWARGEKTRLASALGLPEGAASVNGGRPGCIERVSDRKQRIKLGGLDWSRFPRHVQENLEAIRCMSGNAQAGQSAGGG